MAKDILDIFSIIVNNYENTNNQTNNYIFKSINKYLILIIIVYSFHFLFAFCMCGFTTLNKVHLLMIFYYVFMLILKKKTYVFGIPINIYSFVSYIVLLTSLTFLSIHTNYSIKVEFYFFPVLSSIPFLFDLKKDWGYVSSVFIIAILFILFPLFFSVEFVEKNKDLNYLSVRFMSVANVIISILTLFVTIYFVHEKEQYIHHVTLKKDELEGHFNELEEKYFNLMKNQFQVNNLTEHDILEIYRLAETSAPVFLDKFCFFFPDFKNTLDSKGHNLSYNDMIFCALIKLNYDTKKMAQILNLTVRAVESKKYRLKKKLNINNETNINEYLIKL